MLYFKIEKIYSTISAIEKLKDDRQTSILIVIMRIKQSVKRELRTLATQLKEQIWFPPDTPSGYIFRYGVTIFLCLLMTLFMLLFPERDAKTSLYILFL